MTYVVKGEASPSESGVNRQSEEGKLDYTLLRDGPMFKRWAGLLTRAIPKRGRRNWMLAGRTPETAQDDLERFKRGACRHFEQWLDGETDEDHAAALFFNVNGVEYVKARIEGQDFEVDWLYELAKEILQFSQTVEADEVIANANNAEMGHDEYTTYPNEGAARTVTAEKVGRKVLGEHGIKDVFACPYYPGAYSDSPGCCGDPGDCHGA